MSKSKKPFDFKSLNITIKIDDDYGSDYMPYNISKSIFERFPDQIKYDKSMTFIFYPEFARGKIGLIYCFSENSNASTKETFYFGWGTLHTEITKTEITDTIGELYLFADNEHTTDAKKAEETMFKYILQKRYQ